MKHFVLIVLGDFLFTAHSAEAGTKQCKNKVYSKGILKLVNSQIKDLLERQETTYTQGISYTSHKHPMFCDYEDGLAQIMIPVKVDTWSEEGPMYSAFETNCYMDLSYQDKKWQAVYMSCEEIDIEEDY